MSKITFPGGAGAGGAGDGSGLAPESGLLYVLLDGTRPMTGNLIPDGQKLHSVGNASTPFGSGLFDRLTVGDESTSGVRLSHGGAGSILEVQRGDGGSWSRVQALDFKDSTSSTKLDAGGLHLASDTDIAFTSTTTESGPQDLVFARGEAGLLHMGDGASASGAAIKGSGAYFSGNLEATSGLFAGATTRIGSDIETGGNYNPDTSGVQALGSVVNPMGALITASGLWMRDVADNGWYLLVLQGGILTPDPTTLGPFGAPIL